MPQEDKNKLISIIIPAYKQAETIQEDIKKITQVLTNSNYTFELIVVVDGFSDQTYEKAKTLESQNIKILGYEKNHGKGYAVKYGILKAKGDLIGFIDAGMDISPEAIPQMIELQKETDADIVIGSKIHKKSKVKYPILRKILSGGYQTINQILFGFDVKDIQVGLKIFKKNVASEIFARVSIKGFAFDIESLALANSLGYKKIVEAPVDVAYKKGSISSANFWIVATRMLSDTALVYYNLKSNKYAKMQK